MYMCNWLHVDDGGISVCVNKEEFGFIDLVS